MGGVKAMWMESQERGWDAPDKVVCGKCVGDPFLANLITQNASSNKCDYCGARNKNFFAAPVETIMDAVSFVLNANFSDPTCAGLPRDDGEWVGEEGITDTDDALASLGWNGDAGLVADVADSFHNDAWYPCANGHWLDVHEHEELDYAWERFVRDVKHTRRYFFTLPADDETTFSPSEKYTSAELLERIGELVTNLGLTRKLTADSALYRARRSLTGKTYNGFSDLGPPPEDVAAAGRMNPAGISYFYLAFDVETAVAEVVSKGQTATVAKFALRHDLTVLDLSSPPQLPSIFDEASRAAREESLFLLSFTRAISQPIEKDGREHVDYVPSQIVSEYLAQVFRTEDGHRIAGIIYPSTVRPNGLNLVLFPGVGNDLEWDRAVALVSVQSAKPIGD